MDCKECFICPRLPPLFPRLASAASAGASAPCDCRARFRAAFRWLFFLGSGGPNCFRFRQIPRLLGPNGFNGFSPVDARPEAWRTATRGADERGERGAGAREEKRREGRSVAFVPLVDGAPGRALASLGLRGSYRTRGLRPHPISACPVIDVDHLRWIPPPPPPPPDSAEIRS